MPYTALDTNVHAHGSVISEKSMHSENTCSADATNERQISLGTEPGQEIQFSVVDSSLQGASSMNASSPIPTMSTDGNQTNINAAGIASGPSRASPFAHFATGTDRPQRDTDTFDMSQTSPMLLQPPSPKAPLEQRMDFLQQQLDSFGTDKPALPDLVLLGNGDRERLQGGMLSSSGIRNVSIVSQVYYMLMLVFRCGRVNIKV